jgi:hypothetical protein
MDRITAKQIRNRYEAIKTALGQDIDNWTRHLDGRCTAAIGNLELDHNGCGFELGIIVNSGGGIHNLSQRLSTKEMDAYLRGFQAALKLDETRRWVIR